MSRSTSDACRAALKAAGYTARQVTVRSRRGYRTIEITIRDASVRLAAVEAIVAASVEPIEWDGDGQPFTARGYRLAYLDEIIAPIADEIERRLLASDGRGTKIGIQRVRVAREGRYGGPDLWVNGSHYCCGVRHGSLRLASDLLSSGIAIDDAPDAWLDRLDLLDPATATADEIREWYPCIKDRPPEILRRCQDLLVEEFGAEQAAGSVYVQIGAAP